MNDSKFNALIALLDDPDPEVARQVEAELTSLGLDGIPRLEQAWETISDGVLQQRLEELITRLQVGHFTEELYTWRQGGGGDLFEGWLLLTQVQYPTLNVQKYRNELNRLANKTWLETSTGMNDLERLSVVNRMLYGRENYGGNFADPDKPDNFFLSQLIDTKHSNSLGLSVFYLILCHQLQIPMQVVHFGGYYALKYYQPNSHFYIDAFNKGMFFTPKQVQQFLKKMKANENLNHYKPLSNIYIILHLIDRLIEAYKGQDAHNKADIFTQLRKDIDISFE
jgi:regulator of sirC expression with transglutaminase-like and TPR domain